jgi:hypothetical protein
MPWVGFEPMIPAFEQAKTAHALDRATTVIGKSIYRHTKRIACPTTNQLILSGGQNGRLPHETHKTRNFFTVTAHMPVMLIIPL